MHRHSTHSVSSADVVFLVLVPSGDPYAIMTIMSGLICCKANGAMMSNMAHAVAHVRPGIDRLRACAGEERRVAA